MRRVRKQKNEKTKSTCNECWVYCQTRDFFYADIADINESRVGNFFRLKLKLTFEFQMRLTELEESYDTKVKVFQVEKPMEDYSWPLLLLFSESTAEEEREQGNVVKREVRSRKRYLLLQLVYRARKEKSKKRRKKKPQYGR